MRLVRFERGSETKVSVHFVAEATASASPARVLNGVKTVAPAVTEMVISALSSPLSICG
jgi:hypothetical protein